MSLACRRCAAYRDRPKTVPKVSSIDCACIAGCGIGTTTGTLTFETAHVLDGFDEDAYLAVSQGGTITVTWHLDQSSRRNLARLFGWPVHPRLERARRRAIATQLRRRDRRRNRRNR